MSNIAIHFCRHCKTSTNFDFNNSGILACGICFRPKEPKPTQKPNKAKQIKAQLKIDPTPYKPDFCPSCQTKTFATIAKDWTTKEILIYCPICKKEWK